MIISNLNDYTRGWIIGNFQPSVLQTQNFEVGIMYHPKGQKNTPHYHAKVTEYNILISGSMIIQNTIIKANTVFILEPYEIADPEFLEDCIVVCVKTPSIPDDKYNLMEKTNEILSK